MIGAAQFALDQGYSAGSTQIAGAIGAEVAKRAVNQIADSQLDWTGTNPPPLSDLEKAGVIGLKVLAAAGATAAIIFVPQVTIPLLCHHGIGSLAVTAAVKGGISGARVGVDDYLTKQLTGNYTPDVEKRKEYTDAVGNVKKGLAIGGSLLAGPYAEEIKGAAELLETGAVSAYDSAPEKANETIEKIKQFFSFGQ